MGIPLQNLYYLLAYAWDCDKSSGVRSIKGLSAKTPMDLIAELLVGTVDRLLRRGLDQGYVDHCVDLRSPRGKMDLSVTARRGLLARRQVHCHVSELLRNVAHNQAKLLWAST